MDTPNPFDLTGKPPATEAPGPKPKPKAKKPAAKKAAKPKAKKVKPAAKKAAKPKAKKKPKVVKTGRKPGKPKVKPAAVARPERLDMRVSKAEKAKLLAKAKKSRRTVTSIMLEAIEKIK
jgi:hypothetical protein